MERIDLRRNENAGSLMRHSIPFLAGLAPVVIWFLVGVFAQTGKPEMILSVLSALLGGTLVYTVVSFVIERPVDVTYPLVLPMLWLAAVQPLLLVAGFIKLV